MLKLPTLRAHMTYHAHLFKALTRQHHTDLLPFLGQYVPQDGVVIDVGAHAGQFTKLFSKMVPQGHVYAFEPGSYALSILRKVVRLHGLKNVTLTPAGLSDAESTAVLQVPIKKSGSLGFGLSSLGKIESGATHDDTVTLTTLDAFAAAHAIARMDLIKSDIEGWELHMLRGARQSIARFRPVLMLEACDARLRRAGDSFDALIEFLTDMHYDCFAQDKQGNLSALPDNKDCDLVAIPRRH